MKSIKKFFFVMVALATALAFVSCSNDDDPSTVAVYKGLDDGVMTTITFYDDDTWKLVVEYEGVIEHSGNGTYKGDPTKDGIITLMGNGETAYMEVKNGKLDDFYTRQ
ncbi:MAG: copper resistance protein NlpE [Treponema sp.]|nr:copper resistance protein NlpE [Treponema sp.]